MPSLTLSYPLFFPLLVIMNSIDRAVETLRGTVAERNIEDTKLLKLVEIIGEWECCIKTIVMLSDVFSYQYFIHFVFTGESLPQAVLRWGDGNCLQMIYLMYSIISVPSSSRTTMDPGITSSTPSAVSWASGTFSLEFVSNWQLVISVFLRRLYVVVDVS